MQHEEPSAFFQQPADTHAADDCSQEPGLTRQQKRALRLKRAKLRRRAVAQESNHSEAAEDLELQLAYEAHLRSLQEQHPPPQQQQQQQRQPGRGGKRRRGGKDFGTATATASADTLGSGCAVPAAAPTQRLAQISELSGPYPVAWLAQQHEQQQQQQQQQQQPGSICAAQPAAAAVAGPAAALEPAPGSREQQQQQHDWSGPAAMLARVLAEREEQQVAVGAAAKTADICRLDLSAAALLIGSALAPEEQPAAPATAALGLPSAAAAEAAAAGGAEAGAAEAEDATEAAAGGEQQGARKRQRTAVHGNYHRYYGYRVGAAPAPGSSSSAGGEASGSGSGSGSAWAEGPLASVASDPRLAAFERHWFHRRRCLDVGCNEGLVTLALAARFGARSMLGVDIDPALISRACRNLREARSAVVERAQRRGGVPPADRKAAQAAAAALAQTLFACSDFLESEVEAGSLDTITCLSVTKWVHLNRGDAGLQALFAAFHAALAPGGLLLLEPQPWSSYQVAARKVPRRLAPPQSFFHRQHELRLRPDGFAAYLSSALGFRLVKAFGGRPDDVGTAGFQRPLLLLRKGHQPPPVAPPLALAAADDAAEQAQAVNGPAAAEPAEEREAAADSGMCSS